MHPPTETFLALGAAWGHILCFTADGIHGKGLPVVGLLEGRGQSLVCEDGGGVEGPRVVGLVPPTMAGQEDSCWAS